MKILKSRKTPSLRDRNLCFQPPDIQRSNQSYSSRPGVHNAIGNRNPYCVPITRQDRGKEGRPVHLNSIPIIFYILL